MNTGQTELPRIHSYMNQRPMTTTYNQAQEMPPRAADVQPSYTPTMERLVIASIFRLNINVY